MVKKAKQRHMTGEEEPVAVEPAIKTKTKQKRTTEIESRYQEHLKRVIGGK